MYLGLFLTPWLTMYALSTIVFNHWGRINQYYGGKMGQYEPEKEVPYHKAFGAHEPLREKGVQILRDLNLSGSFGIREDEGRIIIDRRDPVRPRRITYAADQGKLIVERQSFRAAQLLTTLHSQVGYENKLKRVRIWAFSVDLSTVATILLVFTGFWMWWELKVTRVWGMVFVVSGLALVGLFLRFA
ncbi:MAG TPA: hypothetical protein VHB50_15395 [Bryobacteraceae bacterium]|nr:hypothetical protein [Bryobacteraceae bacterium]